jgi:hypothetical protein
VFSGGSRVLQLQGGAVVLRLLPLGNNLRFVGIVAEVHGRIGGGNLELSKAKRNSKEVYDSAGTLNRSRCVG